MAITVKHKFVSAIPDAGDTSLVQPSNWNDDHDLVGTIPILNGGTGASTANGGFNALAPSQTGNSGKYLTTDGSNTSWATNPLGTVTSVGLSAPSIFTVSGSPVTSSGTLALTYSGTALPVANGGTGVTSSSGANSVVLRDSNGNITTNCLFEGYVTQAASGTTIVLIASSAQNYQITGLGGQIIRLPDATTLPNGATFTFNNNQSSGAITVQNNSSTTVATINSGGYVTVVLLNNSTAAGSWDRHDSTPSNVSWSTNTLDYAGSITSATWNGNTVSVNRGGTGATTLTGYVKGSGTSALTANATIPTTDLSGTITNAQLANSSITINGNNTSLGGSVSVGTVTSVAATGGTGISITGSPITSSGTLTITNTAPDQTVAITSGIGISVTGTYPNFTVTNTSPSSGGTVTSVTGTAPISSSGGNTPAISISQATTSTNGYLSSTDWNTFNNKQPAGTYVNSVSATSPITSTGGVTPTIAIPVASASANGYLSSTDWTTFNNKQAAGTYVNSVSGTSGRITSTGGTTPVIDLASGVATAGTTGSSTLIPVVTIDTYGRVTSITTASNPQGTVTSVTGTAPIVSSGGATPAISIPAATSSVNGYLTSTDWTTFNNKAPALTYTTNYIPYGQGTTTPALSANFTYDPTLNNLTAPQVRASNGIIVNSKTVSASYTIASGDSGMSVGPVTVATGQTVTVASGSRWVVL
jgi:hypothetical protein